MNDVHRIVILFFSSRRRHTRWTGDWSSDVCSSDLAARQRRPVGVASGRRRVRENDGRTALREDALDQEGLGRRPERRSEERRVGKECRWRWWAQLEKKR